MEYIKIVVRVDAGIAGTDSCEFYEVNSDSTEDKRSEFAWECAKQHAEMYGIYPRHEYEEAAKENGEEFEDSDDYSDSIEGHWEPYSPEEHDGKRVGKDHSWTKVDL